MCVLCSVCAVCVQCVHVNERVCAVRTHMHLSVPLSQRLLLLMCGVICMALCPALGNGAEGLGELGDEGRRHPGI